MKNGLRFFLISILLGSTLLSTDALAQRRQMDQETWVARSLDSMTEAVGLSEQQVALIQPILVDQFEKQMEIRSARSQGGNGRNGMRAAMTDIRNEADEKIVSLLDEDQVPKFEAWRKETQQRRFRSRGNND